MEKYIYRTKAATHSFMLVFFKNKIYYTTLFISIILLYIY